MSFTTTFLDYTKELETPSSFFRWGSYAIIGAILRDNVFLPYPDKDRPLYPNIFVILIAKSATHRKDTPIAFAEDLVSSLANTKVIAGRASIEAILDELAGQETNPATGKILAGGSCILCERELLASFVSSDSLVPILTDLYNFKKEYVSRLRGSGKFKIKNLCVSMLAASNEIFLREIYTTMAVHGGLLGRTFIISPDEDRPPNPLFRSSADLLSPNGNHNIRTLLDPLVKISNLRGSPTVESDAAKEYQTWYISLKNNYRNKSDPSGFIGRVHTGVLKLAMIIGVGDEFNLVIKKKHIEEAINECTKIIKNYELFIMGTGKSTIQEIGVLVIYDLWNSTDHQMSKREIMRNHWGVADVEIVDKLVIALEQGGLITRTITGSDEVIKMTKKCEEIYGRKS